MIVAVRMRLQFPGCKLPDEVDMELQTTGLHVRIRLSRSLDMIDRCRDRFGRLKLRSKAAMSQH